VKSDSDLPMQSILSRLVATNKFGSNLLNVRGGIIAVTHLAMIVLSFVAAFWIRLDFSTSVFDSPYLITGLKFVIAIKMTAFILVGLQMGWWRYAGLPDLLRICIGNIVASLVSFIAIYSWFGPGSAFPRSIYLIDLLICFLLTAGSRFCVRLYVETVQSRLSSTGKGILIYGAGQPAGLYCVKRKPILRWVSAFSVSSTTIPNCDRPESWMFRSTEPAAISL
jgi:FlaA1/EpsC-like NDP-sugar epimerase